MASARTGWTRSWSGAIAARTRGEMNMLWPLITGRSSLVADSGSGSGRAAGGGWAVGGRRWMSIDKMISLRCSLLRKPAPYRMEISMPGFDEALHFFFFVLFVFPRNWNMKEEKRRRDEQRQNGAPNPDPTELIPIPHSQPSFQAPPTAWLGWAGLG